jgi:hypothetical protein
MSYFDRDKTSGNQGGTQWPEPHHGMVSEYQQSGFPFAYYKSVSGLSGDKLITLTLPYVSRWVKLYLEGTLTGVKVGFADYTTTKGIQGQNYVMATASNQLFNTSVEMKVKVILIHVPDAINDLEINLLAGLTNIRNFPDIHLPKGSSPADIIGVNQEAEVTATSTTHGFTAIYSVANDTTITS